MDAKSKRPKRREDLLSLLTVAIEGLSVAEKLVSITPARVVFSTVGVTLMMIRVGFLPACEDPLQTNRMYTGLDD